VTGSGEKGYTENVYVVETAGRQFVLVGTAHVSRESTALVREVIERERPDHVCVELDPQRYKALVEKSRWESLDLKQVIRRKQLSTLLVTLLLTSYQKKIAGSLGVMPGMELLEATRVAQELKVPFSLCDRNIRVTLLRAWRSMSFFQKFKFMAAVLAGLFERPELSEEDIEKIRRQDVLSEMMKELAQAMPALKEVLIDERDLYLAEKIRTAEGSRIVAVVGAGHVEGIRKALAGPGGTDLESLCAVVTSSSWGWKSLGWAIPAIILGSLGLIAWTQGGEVAGKNLMYWILANGIPSSLGAALALAHPLTILTAFLAAPITSLTPVIGAGYVTAFVQAYVRPPLVRDFQSLTDDAGSFKMWWRNKLLRVILAFILPGFGSLIGTYVGGYEIISNLF